MRSHLVASAALVLLAHCSSAMVSVAVAPPARTPKPRALLRKRRDGKQGPWVPPDRAARLNDQLTASAAYSVVVVDGNNVRGLNGFRWSAPRLQELVRTWARAHKLEGRVVIVWDHGACPCAFTADGVGLAFAGPRATADDVIATQTGVILASGVQRVWLATSDRELMERALAAGTGTVGAGGAARKQTAHAPVRIISSGDFAALIAPPEEVGLLATAPADVPLVGAAVAIGAADGSAASALSRPAAAAQPAAASNPHALSLGSLAAEVLLAEFGQSEAELRERALVLMPMRARLKQRRVRQRRGRPGGASVPRSSFKEKTWHRVVLAERLRRLLAREEGYQSVPRGEDSSGWLDQYTFGYNGALGGGAAEPRPLLDDRRLDAEGRSELIRFARALCEAEAAADEGGEPDSEATGVVPVSALAAVAGKAACSPAQLGGAHSPKVKLTRRERRLLRSSRSRHADVHSSVHPKSERDAALAALDRWLARGPDADDKNDADDCEANEFEAAVGMSPPPADERSS